MALKHVVISALLLGATHARADGMAEPSGPLALLPPLGAGLNADELARVEKTLRAEVDARFGARSIAGADVRARLEAASEQGLRCDRESPACLAQIGIVCRADQVIIAKLTPTGASMTISLRLISVDDATELAAVTRIVTGDPQVRELRALLDLLDSPAARITKLTLRGPPGARVYVDGATRGRLPMLPITDIAPGPHEIAIIGELRFHQSIDLRRGDPIVVDAPPPPAPVFAHPKSPALPPTAAPESEPLAGVTFAAGGALSVVGGVLILIGLSPRFAYNDAATRLHALEGTAAGDPNALPASGRAVDAARADLDRNALAWSAWGVPLVITGGIGLGIGLGTATVGAVMLAE